MAAIINIKNDNQYNWDPPPKLEFIYESCQQFNCDTKVNGAIKNGETKEATDTYLVKNIIKENIINPIIEIKTEIEQINPKFVAAPFPPLNLKNIGKIWPKITASVIAWTYNPLKNGTNFCKLAPMKVNQYDFDTSNKKINNPNFQP